MRGGAGMKTMSRVDKLIWASRICWLISLASTFNFVRIVMAATFTDVTVSLAVAFLVSFGVQWVLTQAETALFDGTFPPPWKVKWRLGGAEAWLTVGALMSLLLDVLLNLGGIAFFFKALKDADLGQDLIGIDAGILDVVTTVLAVGFAVFAAVGSELLLEFAKYIQSKPTREKVAEDEKRERERQEKELERELSRKLPETPRHSPQHQPALQPNPQQPSKSNPTPEAKLRRVQALSPEVQDQTNVNERLRHDDDDMGDVNIPDLASRVQHIFQRRGK